jgi:hypothetical protein
MKNQASGKGGASGKIQAMVEPGSKKFSGKRSAAGSSQGKSTSASGVAGVSSGVTDSPIVPHGAKAGHL